jgi:phosphoglycolate phosphatase-like HAD superfamily hydrolase
MKLVIFDIDGTLTNTSKVDSNCFARTYAELLDVQDLDVHWNSFSHVTDSGITQQLFQQRFHRDPQAAEIQRIHDHFLHLLREQHAADESLFAEIPGASAIVEHLKASPEWAITFATGCWQASARFKMQAAGIDFDGLPAGFAEDGISRETIVQAAIERAHAHYGQQSFDRIVSVGDGTWDVRTAKNLNLDFIGIGDAKREQMLRAEGAQHVIEHYQPADHFQALLRTIYG